MTAHDERMRRIGSVAAPELTSEQVERLVASLPKHRRKEIERRFKIAVALLRGTMQNGAGLLMDTQLREFLDEYNGRLWKYGFIYQGNSSMPLSFNTVEAFMRYDPKLNVFRLGPEHDHLFSFSDFVDYATNEGATEDPYRSALEEFADGAIYSYTSYEDPHDLSFSIGEDEFVVGGVSYVRNGTELTALIVGGKVADLAAENMRLPVDVGVGRVEQPAPTRRREAAPLASQSDIWKTLAIGRYELNERSELVRYILRDYGDSYAIGTDDPAADVEHDLDELSAHAVLFEIMKLGTLLPKYYKAKLTLVRDDKRETQYSRDLGAPATRAGASAVRPVDRVLFRRVAALRIINPNRELRIARRFTAPQYRVEVNGFWRRLDPDSVGHGPRGEQVIGRTWVTGHLRWRERPERPVQVLVKSRLSIAKAIVEAEQRERAVASSPSPGPAESLAREAEVSRETAYRERRLLTARVRWRVLQRDNFRCQVCGADAASDHSVRLDVDHVLPVSKGGKTESANLRTLCSKCNNGKGTLTQ